MQPVIDAEAWQAKRSLLLEVRKPSRRQDPTVWETFAKHPGAFRSVGCHQLTVRALPRRARGAHRLAGCRRRRFERATATNARSANEPGTHCDLIS